MCQDYLRDLIDKTDVVWSNSVAENTRGYYNNKVFSSILNELGVNTKLIKDPAMEFITLNLKRIASESANVGAPMLNNVLQELNKQGGRLRIKIYNDDSHLAAWSSSDKHPFNIRVNLKKFLSGNDSKLGAHNLFFNSYNVTSKKTINGKEVFHVDGEYDPFHITLVHELGHINDWIATRKNRREYIAKKTDKKSLPNASRQKYPILKDFVLYPEHFENIGEVRNIVGAGNFAKTPQIFSENAFRAEAGYNIRASHARPEKGGFFITRENAYDLVPSHMFQKADTIFRGLANKGNIAPSAFNPQVAPHALALTPTKILREFGNDFVYRAKTGHLPQLQDKFRVIKDITRQYPSEYAKAKGEFHRNDVANVMKIVKYLSPTGASPSFIFNVSDVYNKKHPSFLSGKRIDEIRERKRMEKFNIFLRNMERMFG